jgi:hypothetical protein
MTDLAGAHEGLDEDAVRDHRALETDAFGQLVDLGRIGGFVNKEIKTQTQINVIFYKRINWNENDDEVITR